MTLTSFLQLVELKTKVASILPYLFGSFYTLYAFERFDFINALIMFFSMLIFDMTVTAINNYIDYTSAIQKEGYGYDIHNAISRYHLNLKHVRILIFAMLSLSAALGLWLVMRTDILVLLLGIVCFIIGILYTFGPLPISRTPFGEVFSGVTMGFILTFITIYIHNTDTGLLSLGLCEDQFFLQFNFKACIGIFLVCIPLVCSIANIMLANNLCDMKEDLVNKRYTLPIYIGCKSGLFIWKSLYYFSFIIIILCVSLKFLPLTSLLTLIAILPIKKNIALFEEKQTKKETFILSIKNFLALNVSYLMTLILGLVLKTLL